MSRISFITNIPSTSRACQKNPALANLRVEVVAGWDPPLKYFFMDIFETGDRSDEMVWASLDYDWSMEQVTTTRYEDILKNEYGIDVPEGFWEEVLNSVDKYNYVRKMYT